MERETRSQRSRHPTDTGLRVGAPPSELFHPRFQEGVVGGRSSEKKEGTSRLFCRLPEGAVSLKVQDSTVRDLVTSRRRRLCPPVTVRVSVSPIETGPKLILKTFWGLRLPQNVSEELSLHTFDRLHQTRVSPRPATSDGRSTRAQERGTPWRGFPPKISFPLLL